MDMDLWWLEPDTFVTSDQHWSHDNIRKYQGRPDDHFEIMWERWNAAVGPRDHILHLGDLVYGGDKQLHGTYLKGLNGVKHLVLGNHDRHTREFYEKAGFEIINRHGFLHVFEDYFGDDEALLVRFSHEPDKEHLDWDINVHGHIHGNEYFSSTPYYDYRNVSVEVTDFKPVRIQAVLEGKAGNGRLNRH